MKTKRRQAFVDPVVEAMAISRLQQAKAGVLAEYDQRSQSFDIRDDDGEAVNAGQVRRDGEYGGAATAVCTDDNCVIKMRPHSHRVVKG